MRVRVTVLYNMRLMLFESARVLKLDERITDADYVFLTAAIIFWQRVVTLYRNQLDVPGFLKQSLNAENKIS